MAEMTEEEFQAHMMTLWAEGQKTITPRPRIVCADGFSVSVQAGWGKYCQPRTSNYIGSDEDDYFGPFSQWELGFPSARPTDEIMEHIDGGPDEDPTDTVYGYVPTAKVVALINAHGGIVHKEREQGRAG